MGVFVGGNNNPRQGLPWVVFSRTKNINYSAILFGQKRPKLSCFKTSDIDCPLKKCKMILLLLYSDVKSVLGSLRCCFNIVFFINTKISYLHICWCYSCHLQFNSKLKLEKLTGRMKREEKLDYFLSKCHFNFLHLTDEKGNFIIFAVLFQF